MVSGNAITCGVYGAMAKGDATGNKAGIINNSTVNSKVYGAYTEAGSKLEGNRVDVESNSTVKEDIYGAYSANSAKVTATKNEVTIKGAKTITEVIAHAANLTKDQLEVEEDDTGDTDPGDSEFPEDDEEDVVEQSLDGSVNDEPLLSHPKAQSGINDAQREYLKAVQDGTRLWELVNELNEDGSPKKDKDGQPVMKPLKQLLKNLSDNGKEVLKMLLQGIHSYRSPGATFREARMVRSSAVNLSGLGKIATPADAPTPSGRNWLLVGKSFSRTSSGKKNRWRVETIYELSGASGWNKKLYGN